MLDVERLRLYFILLYTENKRHAREYSTESKTEMQAISNYAPMSIFIINHAIYLKRQRGNLAELQSTPRRHHPPPSQETVNFTRMNNDKDQHHKEHECGIKYIDKHFRRKEITVIPLDILGNTENRPNEN